MGLQVNGVNVKEVNFNQSSVNYLVKDTKLVWASPKIYLQGPTAYTVVGSPTITNGVVSDFTSNDYFVTAQALSTTGISSFDFYSRVKTPSTFSNGWCRICSAGTPGSSGNTAGIYTGTSSYFHLFGRDIWQQSITADTWYRIQYICSQTEYTVTVYDDNGNVLKSLTGSTPALNLQGVLTFGQTYSSYTVDSIDLNNTYIKVNNQVWFGKFHATQDIAPVYSGLTFGNITTTDTGVIDMPSQTFVADSTATWGKDQ